MFDFLHLPHNCSRFVFCLLTLAAGVGTASAQAPERLILEKQVVQDTIAVHKDAFTFLKPQGWQANGGVHWYPNLWHQACLELQVSNPAGPERVVTLPYCYYCWIANPIVPMAQGSLYMGQVVQPPETDPKAYAQKYVLPTFADGTRPALTGYQEMPQLAKVLSQLHGVPVRFGKVRVEYTRNGQPVEEDYYVSVYHVRTFIAGHANDFWGPAWPPFALRAAKGQLDAKTPLLMSLAESIQMDGHWYAEYQYVCDLYKQRLSNGVQNAVNLSKHIAANGQAIFEMHKKSWELQQSTQDKLAQKFSDATLGVTSYKSPYHTYPVQLPSTYQHAWVNGNGQYFLTNNPNLDPNVGSTQSWQLLKTAN